MCVLWNCRSESSKTPVQSSEKKNKKKKKSNEEAKEESKAISSRTYPNGLVVEEMKMGKPNGKKATPGKQVYLIIMIYMIYYVVYCFPRCSELILGSLSAGYGQLHRKT